MTRPQTAELPSALLDLLDGSDLERKEGDTLLLSTAREDGWPRLALLSVGEVYAPGPTELRFALWPGSQTTANLTANRRGTLAAFVEGRAIYVELEARRVDDVDAAGMHLARFVADVRAVRADEVGYAELTSGVRYRLHDPARVLARWRAQLDALRALSV